MSLWRDTIGRMAGYVPGEQPRDRRYIKLNTNENPYPPSPRALAALAAFSGERLRLYPDPASDLLRDTAARVYGLPGRDWVLAGNGSDDLLTIAVRTFVDPGGALAHPEPSYSLYPVLAGLQGARAVAVPLDAEFANEWQLYGSRAKDGMLLTRDGIHMTPRGNEIIAAAMLATWKLA